MRVSRSNRFGMFVVICVLINVVVTLLISQINYYFMAKNTAVEYEYIESSLNELADRILEANREITDQIEVSSKEIVSELPEPEFVLTDEEINMLAQLTMAESGNQPVLGQRLVIDTVLNRVESPDFPNTVEEVIYQKYHFSPIWDGNFEKCYPREDLVALVKEELVRRTDKEVIFFQAGSYSPYGEDLYKIGGHYFSKQK